MTAPLAFSFRNDLATDMTVVIEPWAEEVILPSQGTIDLEVTSAKSGKVETSIDQAYLTIWLWAGCTVSMAIDKVDVTPRSLNIPVPG